MPKRIRAREARKLYFEHYVTFENEIRRVARKHIDRYRTYKKTLKQIIIDISITNTSKGLKLPIREIKAQRLVRNWLAHQNAHTLADVKKIKMFGKIQELSKQLISL